MVVNNAFNFDNLFDNNGEGQTFEAAAPLADNMEDSSYAGYAYVDWTVDCKFTDFWVFCLNLYE